MAFVTDSNRPQSLWRPPPTAAGADSEVPSLLMHPCSTLCKIVPVISEAPGEGQPQSCPPPTRPATSPLTRFHRQRISPRSICWPHLSTNPLPHPPHHYSVPKDSNGTFSLPPSFPQPPATSHVPSGSARRHLGTLPAPSRTVPLSLALAPALTPQPDPM